MKELTIQDKIQILKNAIKHLKECQCVGMCIAISTCMREYTSNIIIPHSTLDYYYPDFTQDSYIKFYRFNKTVKQCKGYVYWDAYDGGSSMKRRIIFLRYLILKLRIQQFKQWYTTLH